MIALNFTRFTLVFVAVLAVVFALVAKAAGGTIDLQTLIDNPPFGKAPEGGAAAETDPQAIEFRGYIVDQGVRYFSLYDPTEQKSYWVGEKDAGRLAIKSFDADDGALIIEQGGKSVRLKLKMATISSNPIVPVAMPSNVRVGRMGANLGNRTAAPVDPKRLEAIAAEVARRRQQRLQQLQQQPQAQAGGATSAPAPARTN